MSRYSSNFLRKNFSENYSNSSSDHSDEYNSNYPEEYQELLDINKLSVLGKYKNRVKVCLVKTNDKGIGLFAKKKIKIGETIAYYKMKVYNTSKYNSPTNNVYTFNIYRKNGKQYKNFIGDIYLKSFPKPQNGITFWAPFANEPSPNQTCNSEIDTFNKFNFKSRKKLKVGDNVIYRLVAKKNIKPGTEIVWFYGDDYERDYLINSESSESSESSGNSDSENSEDSGFESGFGDKINSAKNSS